jgi:subtilase family serine protease
MRISRSFSKLRGLVPALALSLGFVSSLHAAVQNRISGQVGGSYVELAHSVHPRVKESADGGAAQANLPLQSLSLRFNMTPTQQAALTQLLIEQQTPNSPNYHKWLTAAQFGAEFGLSSADLAMVSSWLTSQGFTIQAVAHGGMFIQFSGTVAQAEQAFHTSIHRLSFNGEQHIANVSAPELPAGIAGVVSGITGLDDFRARPHFIRRPGVHANNTASTSQGQEHYMAPGDLYTIYNESPLLANGINGTGITIAVVGQVTIDTADMAAFRTASGLNAANLPITVAEGTVPAEPSAAQCDSNNPPASCGDLDESSLDVEWAGAAAPDATIKFVTSSDVIYTSLTDAVDDQVAPIITDSYGGCEAENYTSSELNSLNNTFAQANAEGITITGPAGDDGATDCDDGVTSATHGLAVDFPASSPYVTAVGGTMFTGDLNAPNTYWNSTNGAAAAPAYSGSALQYIPEGVWNETTEDLATNPPEFGAGGGGVSSVFAKPVWQVGTQNDGYRDVPDVALNAAANHDGYYVCIQGSCSNGGFGTATGGFYVFGGTSVATPSFAGFLALVEQKTGGPIANANTVLYALANSTYYGSVFHDITTGNNDSPCTVGIADCTSGELGYTATTGYDQASGWGSVDVNSLVTYWSDVTPLASTMGTAAATTTVTAVTETPATVALGATDVLTITVAAQPGDSLTAAPTGEVTLTVGTTILGTVQLVNGTASYNFSDATAGTYEITAAYSGDTNYAAGSPGQVSVTVGTPTAPSTTPMFTLAGTNVTVAAGSTGTSTVTITPANGYTGTVDWSAETSVPTLLDGCYSIANTAVSGTAPVTATLTIYTDSGQCAAATTTTTTSSAATGNVRRKFASRAPATGVSAVTPAKAPFGPVPMGVAFAGLLAVGLIGRRSQGVRLLMVAGLFAVLGFGISGCSSGTSSTASSSGTDATAGVYAITLTGTDSANAAITTSITAANPIVLTVTSTTATASAATTTAGN